MKMWEISKAMKIIGQKCLKEQQAVVINIFCNTKNAINRLKVLDCKSDQMLKAQIYRKVKQLAQQRHEFSVCWVSSYYKLEGNNIVDKAIKEFASGEKIQTV